MTSRGVADVHVRAWQDAYAGLVRQSVLDALSVTDRKCSGDRFLTQDNKKTFVAEEQGLIRGFANFARAMTMRSLDSERCTPFMVSPECWVVALANLCGAIFDDECRAT